MQAKRVANMLMFTWSCQVGKLSECVTVTGATTPQRLLLVADWGLSQNSSVTLQHLLQSAANTTTAAAVLYIADFCYAGQSFLLAPVRSCNQAFYHGSHLSFTYQL